MSWDRAVRKLSKLAPINFSRPPITPAVIDWDRLVTVDFETYYDPQYTLKKLSTSEYVRDPRFKAQMVGIKIGRKATKVYPTHRIAAELRKINWATHSLLCHNTQFDGFIMSHHWGITPLHYYDTLSMARGLHSNEIGAGLTEVAMFYGKGAKIEGVLEQTKGVLNWPKEVYAKAVEYCAHDVDLTFEIFKAMQPVFPQDEMDLVDITCRMFCDPVLRVDLPRVEQELQRELDERETKFYATVNPRDWDSDPAVLKTVLKTRAERETEGKERDLLIIKKVIGSNERFAELLRAEGIDPPLKISDAWIKLSKEDKELQADSKYTYAFAKDDLEFINLPSNLDAWRGELDPNNLADVPTITARQERIQTLVDCRIAVKSTSNITRAARFLEAGKNGWYLPVGYRYFGAHTGRWAGANKMNMQNLTRGGELRLSILAPKGHVLSVVDSGQIEARVNGWLWGQADLMEAFRKADRWDKSKGVARGTDRDAYCRFADAIYGREITNADKDERFVGKVGVLGLGYQMGAAKLQMTLAKGALGGPPVFFTLEQCQKMVSAYRTMNYRIVLGWATCARIIEEMAAGIQGSHGPINWEKETIWLPNGMSLKYPGLRKSMGDKGWEEWSYQSGDQRKKLYGGLLCENLVQALARIIVGWQMLQISRKYRVVMTTHDEVVASTRKAQADRCFAFMTQVMSTAPDWCPDIPLNCEGGWAENYSK